MNDLIVETDIICVDDKGREHRITVEIGRPYKLDQEFACHVALRGLHDRLAPIQGCDQMQALVLAVAFVRASLQVLTQKGYKIRFPDDGGELDAGEIWFSSLGGTGDPNKQLEHLGHG